MANGTNRVAILLQNVVGVSSFKHEKLLSLKGAAVLAIPAVLGSIVGAQIAVSIDEQTMRRVIGGLMVLMLFVILIRPKRWLQGREDLQDRRKSLLTLVAFFFIGMYGGFIQAGVGIFLLAGLVLGAGYDLVRANAVKVFIILVFTAFALVVFVVNDQVRWMIGLILAIGNMLGAWVAVKTSVRRGAGFVRWVLIGVVAISAVLLLDIPSLLSNIL